MQVKWLRRVLENLDEEAACIAKDSPRMTAELVRHLRDSVAVLADHPEMGRPGRIAGTRELVVTRLPYILPYRMRGGAVEVLRVFCGQEMAQADGLTAPRTVSGRKSHPSTGKSGYR